MMETVSILNLGTVKYLFSSDKSMMGLYDPSGLGRVKIREWNNLGKGLKTSLMMFADRRSGMMFLKRLETALFGRRCFGGFLLRGGSE